MWGVACELYEIAHQMRVLHVWYLGWRGCGRDGWTSIGEEHTVCYLFLCQVLAICLYANGTGLNAILVGATTDASWVCLKGQNASVQVFSTIHCTLVVIFFILIKGDGFVRVNDKNHTGLCGLGFVLIHNDMILSIIAPCMIVVWNKMIWSYGIEAPMGSRPELKPLPSQTTKSHSTHFHHDIIH